jgi:hypothetical protein
MTDGEREIRQEQERDARETEEGGEWRDCDACGGSGYRDLDLIAAGAIDPDDAMCNDCWGLGSWRVF